VSTSIFFDKEKQDLFNEQGYLVLDLLCNEEVIACTEVYKNSDNLERGTRYNTLEVNDYDNRKYVYEALLKILSKPILNRLNGYKFIGFNFAVKKGTGKNFPSHIDDSHTDDHFRGVNVWIPLVDVNAENGALYVVKRSHLLPLPIRGIGLPFAFERFEDIILRKAEKISYKAGQALIFDDRIIHGSPANSTDEERPAIIAGLIPENAEPKIYIRHNELVNEEVELFEAPTEMFFKLQIGKRPVGFKSLGVFEYKHSSLSESTFLSILEGNA